MITTVLVWLLDAHGILSDAKNVLQNSSWLTVRCVKMALYNERFRFQSIGDGFEFGLGLEKGLGLELFGRTQTRVLQGQSLPIIVMGLSLDSDSLKDSDLASFEVLELESTNGGFNTSLYLINFLVVGPLKSGM